MRVFVLLVLLSIPFQQSMAQTEKKQTAVLNHIAVYVADLQKATDFYQGVFDLVGLFHQNHPPSLYFISQWTGYSDVIQ